MVSRKVLIAVFVLAAVFALGVFALNTGADETGSCVACHTSEEVMKKLVKVPALGSGEGEG